MHIIIMKISRCGALKSAQRKREKGKGKREKGKRKREKGKGKSRVSSVRKLAES